MTHQTPPAIAQAATDIDAQIIELRRELRMREHAYPRWVLQGKLSQADADRYVERMRAALRTLEAVQAWMYPTLI
jgi:hypothetical protein